MGGVIALDFDGVLAEYAGWKGEDVTGSPIQGAREFVLSLLGKGYGAVMYTCRRADVVERWLRDNGFPLLAVSDTKPQALLYVDDRGFRFTGDWADVMTAVEHAAANDVDKAILVKAASVEGAYPPADSVQPLLVTTFVDISRLPLEPGAPTTAEQALAKIVEEEMTDAYGAQIDAHLERFPDAVNPFGLERQTQITDLARQVAANRLDKYEQRLHVFLATNPTEDKLVEWLANRAVNDAATWARLDATYARREANKDFFQRNRELREGKFRIYPDSAAEPKCLGVIGVEYDSYDEAERALGSVWHHNCVHFVDRA